MLREDAVAKRKLEHGNPVAILGIRVEANLAGVFFTLDEAKVDRWKQDMAEVMRTRRMFPGEASKLAGRLSFAAQFIFKRLGRALLVPIFRQAKKKSSVMGYDLLLALRWWLQTLTSGLCEVSSLLNPQLTCRVS